MTLVARLAEARLQSRSLEGREPTEEEVLEVFLRNGIGSFLEDLLEPAETEFDTVRGFVALYGAAS